MIYLFWGIFFTSHVLLTATNVQYSNIFALGSEIRQTLTKHATAATAVWRQLSIVLSATPT